MQLASLEVVRRLANGHVGHERVQSLAALRQGGFDIRLISTYLSAMVETPTRPPKTKSAGRKRPRAAAPELVAEHLRKTGGAEGRQQLVFDPSTGKLLVAPEGADVTAVIIDSINHDAFFGGESGSEEITQIYSRIDRELAVEEARADRLLRLYNL
jgi:hypothetical protein